MAYNFYQDPYKLPSTLTANSTQQTGVHNAGTGGPSYNLGYVAPSFNPIQTAGAGSIASLSQPRVQTLSSASGLTSGSGLSAPIPAFTPSAPATFNPLTQAGLNGNTGATITSTTPVVKPTITGTQSPVATPVVTPIVPAPTGSPTPATPASPTIPAGFDLRNRLPNETAEQWQARQASYNAPVVPNSVNSLVNANGYSEYEQSILDKQFEGADAVIDPQAIYNENLKQRQQQIDNINNMYADLMNQARVTGQARSDQNRLQQIMGGIGSTAMGSAQTAGVDAANLDVQKALDNQRRVALDEVFSKVVDAAKAEQAAKELAKAGTVADRIAHIKKEPERRAKLVTNAVADIIEKGVDMTPEELKKLAESIGVNPEMIVSEVRKQTTAKIAEQAQKEADAAKDAADIDLKVSQAEENRAQGAKATAEAGQVGKMSPREAAQTEIEWYKATHPNKSISDEKMETVGVLANAFAPGSGVFIPNSDSVPFVDDRGYATPEGWKTALVAASEAGVTRKEFIEEFGYLIAEGEESSYGLKPADIKIFKGELPVTD